MDSYEYYLLYHQNKNKFMTVLTEDNKEILIALNRLCKNAKLNEDGDVFFEKIVSFIENDTQLNLSYDETLQELITLKSFRLTKNVLKDTDMNLSKLRIAKVIVDFAIHRSCVDEEIKQFCKFLAECLFKESNIRPYIFGISHMIIKQNQELKKLILNKIYENSMKRLDSVGMQNLCYFFRQLCENGLKIEELDFLENYFESDSTSIRKQGIYLLKCLFDYQLLNVENEENWKLFIPILESLEENQSHLILPSLELLHKMKIHKSFEKFWFTLCTLVIHHDNIMVKSFGLNYLLGINDKVFQKQQVLRILEALNATTLYDLNGKQFLEKIQKFIETHSELTFELLIEINWVSLPFYHILEFLRDTKLFNNPSKQILFNFENQSKVIPKRIRNIKIRAMVKNIYAGLLYKAMESIDIQQSLPILYNIFLINDNHDCLGKCINRLKREDFEYIFSDDYAYKFHKFLLLKTHMGRDIDEIKNSVKHMKNNQKLIIEVLCDLNEVMDGYEDIPNKLINETIKYIWTLITEQKIQNLSDSLELLEIELKASKDKTENETFDHLKEIWVKILAMYHDDSQFEYIYLKLSSIILTYDKMIDSKLIEKSCFSQRKYAPYNLFVLTCCQILIVKNNLESAQNIDYIEIIIENIEALLDRSSTSSDIFNIYNLIKMLTESPTLEALELFEQLKMVLKNFIVTASNIIDLSPDFWKSFVNYAWNLIDSDKFSDEWTTAFEYIFSTVVNILNENDKFSLLLTILDFMKNRTLRISNKLIDFYKSCLIEAIFDVNVMMSKDEQLEQSLICEYDDDAIRKLSFRLITAQLYYNLYNNEFSTIIGKKILELSEMSRKKARYYPNSKIHRLKLHYFQPLVFCETIDETTIDILIYELLWVNNQLNIIYMLEIILASHHPNILKLLNNNSEELKAQALKSIFSIAIMQIRIENDFERAEKMIDELYKCIFPYSMGQNFGVRIYSLLAIVLSYDHVKSLQGYMITPTTSKISDTCDVIQKSVEQKNCLKYFNALRNDFRFTIEYCRLKTYQAFYRDIPNVTKMPFEEIIPDKSNSIEFFVAADMVKGKTDCIVIDDEIELGENQRSYKAVVNLQQKYLPIKNQVPSESLLRTLPERFRMYNDNDGCLNTEDSKSELCVVVASLIENDTNLGGLARTCEIFGISKYVIHSLKSQENFEFKTLSRTSEKWIQISEIKKWLLFDYLLNMKRLGYTIIGAEQSGNSVSLLDVKIPKKCVLLLGNERKGIPANLLALLDITIEIPQMGVVRSLNVHVAGAILIWEYAKQHTFN